MRVSFCVRCSANSGCVGEEGGQLRRLDDAARRRLERLHRRRARRAVERQLADVLARAVLGEDDVATLRRARVGAQAPFDDDVERAAGIALVEEDGLGAERAAVAVRGERREQRGRQAILDHGDAWGGAWRAVAGRRRQRRCPAFAQPPDAPEASADRERARRPLAPVEGMRLPQEQRRRRDEDDEEQQREHLHARRRRGVEALEGIERERRFRPARRDVGRAPAGRLQPDAQLVERASRAPRVARQLGVDLQVGADRVPAPERRARAVDAGHGAVFLGIGAEQAIPDAAARRRSCGRGRRR